MIAIAVLFGIFAALVAPSAIIAIMVRRVRWSRTRAILVSALPLPLILSVLPIWLIIESITTPRESCGIDACSWNLDVAAMWLVVLAVVFLFGRLSAGMIIDRAGAHPSHSNSQPIE